MKKIIIWFLRLFGKEIKAKADEVIDDMQEKAQDALDDILEEEKENKPVARKQAKCNNCNAVMELVKRPDSVSCFCGETSLTDGEFTGNFELVD